MWIDIMRRVVRMGDREDLFFMGDRCSQCSSMYCRPMSFGSQETLFLHSLDFHHGRTHVLQVIRGNGPQVEPKDHHTEKGRGISVGRTKHGARGNSQVQP